MIRLNIHEAKTHLSRHLADLARGEVIVPFDRMLICQALSGGLVLLTPDDHITRYPVRALW
jgi:PIN domain nuclease of toxin-antitoxin system